MLDLARLTAAYERARDELLAERNDSGYWVGELSSSALSTATAVSALAVVRGRVQGSGFGVQHEPRDLDDLISGGISWLIDQQNDDGGFGDTDLSHSNIATTMLVVAALHLTEETEQHAGLIGRANAYMDSAGGLAALRRRYGIDKTFVVPILTNLALAGLVDWEQIDPLPFELACVPQSLYRFVGMPVVSYAIPALVAIGQARYFHAPPRNPLTRLVRSLCVKRSLTVLRQMQPASGGYLEATPLTSFVVMSLASATAIEGPRSKVISPIADEVIREGVKFLVKSIRPDGSWPIDTNLATWNTTLAIKALGGTEENVAELLGRKCLNWLLSCQHTKRHPFTGAAPGGFGWSDLSGAVPDADDTAGALLAIDELLNQHASRGPIAEGNSELEYLLAAFHGRVAGVRWLVGLQNADGGWPTFCRGWGKLPFDRSGADLTAHALLGISTGDPICEARARNVELVGAPNLEFDYESVKGRARRYLIASQASDGSWSPLWFGNQDHPNEENPVYGTAKVLMAYSDLLMDTPEARRGVAWLLANQNADGGWGSGVWARKEAMTRSPLVSSIEETALAVEALTNWELNLGENPGDGERAQTPAVSALGRGVTWLAERVERDEHRQPAPIGFYFAKLWYYERLYPLIFTVAALGRACRLFAYLERNQILPRDAP